MPQQPRPGGQRPRSSASDIDRFLEEINRRRQQQQQRQREQQEVLPAQPVEAEAVRPRPPVRARPAPAAPPRRRPPVVVEAPIILSEPAIAEVLPVQAVSRIEEAAIPMVASIRRPGVPSHILKLQELLRSKDGLRCAILLHEMLGPPRCKRPRVR